MADLVGIGAQFASQAYANSYNERQSELAFHRQKELQQDAQNYNTLMWNLTNQYNSPMAQMARFKAAGLNPNLIYGQQANTASAPSISAGSAPAPNQTQPVNVVEAAQLGLLEAQKENIQADTAKKMSDVDLNGSVISLNETQEQLNNSMQALNESQAKKVNEEIPLIRTEVKKAFQEYRRLKVDADRSNEFYDAQIRKLSSEAGLADAQARDIVNTYKHRVNLLIAQANKENWSAKQLEKQCALLGEQYVQAVYASHVAEAESAVEGSKGYQWSSKVLGLVSQAVGTVGSIMLGTAALKGVGLRAKTAAWETNNGWSDNWNN